mmetsp:Transcript_2141/g.4788  ORF Transcript_2141/g.4788 Transcript_2141/m.4788 type:complete len:82 (-) Transcript_2141:1939-2184(-)
MYLHVSHFNWFNKNVSCFNWFNKHVSCFNWFIKHVSIVDSPVVHHPRSGEEPAVENDSTERARDIPNRGRIAQRSAKHVVP